MPMNVKKAGLITAGALTALVAASPLAWAVGPSAVAPPHCSYASEGGTDASSESSITDNRLINPVVQTPTGGNNTGVFGECSTYNQHNGEGNFENNTGLPPLPGLPTAG